jgi:cytochrome P450
VVNILAKTEIEIAFNNLLNKFSNIQLDASEWPTETGLFTRGILTLPIKYNVN